MFMWNFCKGIETCMTLLGSSNSKLATIVPGSRTAFGDLMKWTLEEEKGKERKKQICFVHAFVTSRLDQCNNLLFGLPQLEITKLQRVQNTAARVVIRSKGSDHITPILESLHWIPVEHRIKFKLGLIVFKALNDLSADYLKDLSLPLNWSRWLIYIARPMTIGLLELLVQNSGTPFHLNSWT